MAQFSAMTYGKPSLVKAQFALYHLLMSKLRQVCASSNRKKYCTGKTILGLGYFPILPALLLSLSSAPLLADTLIENVRIWRAPDNTRLVFDLDKPIKHSIFQLSNPERLVIDLPPTTLLTDLKKIDVSNTPIKNIRTGKRAGGGLRLVLDLSAQIKPRSFPLPPNESYGNRLVIDLFDQGERVKKNVEDLTSESNRDIVIVIDAGHGGEDPGAIGPGGLYEKHLVFAISKQLKTAIDKQPGYSAVLVRSSDYYLALRDRFAKARSARADMFLSIHADSFRLSSVRGASVYALSTKGASSEAAAYLAQKENRSDLIGGAGSLSLKDKDDQLASVLLDLSMNATLDSSLRIGDLILAEMGKVTKLHKTHVEQAGFAVLKSPDVPSLLIETGFISNPQDAKQLSNASFQKSLAGAIMRGLRGYFDQYPPAGTRIAANQGVRNYVIKRGDTLSAIAQRFDISLKKLRLANGIKGSTIKIGQKLRIPAS